jgi:hypothetical protein
MGRLGGGAGKGRKPRSRLRKKNIRQTISTLNDRDRFPSPFPTPSAGRMEGEKSPYFDPPNDDRSGCRDQEVSAGVV